MYQLASEDEVVISLQKNTDTTAAESKSMGKPEKILAEASTEVISSPRMSPGGRRFSAAVLAEGVMMKKPMVLLGGYFDWLIAHFTLTSEIQRFFSQYKSPHLSFIYK